MGADHDSDGQVRMPIPIRIRPKMMPIRPDLQHLIKALRGFWVSGTSFFKFFSCFSTAHIDYDMDEEVYAEIERLNPEEGAPRPKFLVKGLLYSFWPE
jgi:hypothetical protein